jgi:hypothetical protein
MSRYAIPLSFLILAADVAFAKAIESDSFRPRFYAFENGVRFGSFENEAQTLKQRWSHRARLFRYRPRSSPNEHVRPRRNPVHTTGNQ